MKMRLIKLKELKFAIGDIRAAAEICKYIKNLRHNANRVPSYDCWCGPLGNRYYMHITTRLATRPGNEKTTVKNVIVARRIPEIEYGPDDIKTTLPITFSANINNFYQLLEHELLYCSEYSGLSAYLIYHRLKREYIKQQRGQQK